MSSKEVVNSSIRAGIGLVLVACGYAAMLQNAEQIAKWAAPSYIGLSEEEIFKRSNIPCIRPFGAISGCTYPDGQISEPRGDESRDRANAKLASLDKARNILAIQGPAFLHREEYFDREVAPRRDQLTLWTNILFSLAVIGIVMHALKSLWVWFKTSPKMDMAHIVRTLFRTGWTAGPRGLLASRKLRRLEEDFQALRSLHQNGLISDDDFEQRKEALRSSIRSC